MISPGPRRPLLAKLAALPDDARVPGQGRARHARTGSCAVTPPAAELDYEMWLGPSRMEPYIEARVHMNWRWNYNIGGGQLLDWIGHHCDIAHWGLDFDNTGPLEIEGQGEFPPQDAIWNTCTKYRITCKYPERHHHDHRRRPRRHPRRHQMDRHRRLGLGGPRRLRRLATWIGCAADCRRTCTR